MADFKTTLERMTRGEIDFEAVARNLDKLLSKKPQAAVGIMDQLKQAVVEGIIDAETYARIKARVAGHIEAAPLAHDNARTQFAGPGDATEIVGHGFDTGDGTEILDITSGEFSSTTGGSTTGIDFDLTGESGADTSASWPSGGAQTGQTGTDWAQPTSDHAPTKIQPGAVLRGRFKLDEVLGVGGMGSVYLGSDLIKVRAKDRQPRVALKVLNEDFKQHPDSFIALQREASRQQKLAHPNIATVYDFDQTEDGVAFLVMELLEGQPLNDFVKKVVRPKGGLPMAEAFPMVQGLGNALIYAHERNIVHSDFKPGNCFLTKEGQMKVLDFGIARAVKNPGAAEGETTIFDPGKLGALTPAYASTEMLEGEEPDPRDDIYALACVAYELLTGKHPFNKIPANKARDSGLEPEPVKGLTRKQWRGLARGLAFTRDRRSQTTTQFVTEFEGKTSPWKNPFIVVPAAAVLLAAVGVVPVLNFMDQRDIDGRIAQARTGDPAQIEAMLANLDSDGVDPSKRDRVLTEAKEQILKYFDDAARASIDVANGKFDFTGARLALSKARAYGVYADSSLLNELEQDIDEAESRALAEQFDKFNHALEEGRLLDTPEPDDIHDAMAVVAKIDPKHPMLKDRRLAGAFSNAINRSLQDNAFDHADQLAQVGLGFVGENNANLKNLIDKIGGARDRAETTARLLAAVDAVQKTLDAKGTLADYLPIQQQIVDLASLDPGNELLDTLRRELTPKVKQDLAALEASRNWGASDLMLGNFRQTLRILGLHDENTRVTTLRDEFMVQVTKLRDDMTAAVAAGKLAPEASTLLGELATIAPRNLDTQNARDQLALAQLRSAQRARDSGDTGAAQAALAAARAAAPSTRVTAFLDNEATLATQPASERQAAFDSALPKLEASIAALGEDRAAFSAAFDALQSLRALAPAETRLDGVTQSLTDAVHKAADSLFAASKWDDAVALTSSALVDVPQSSALLAKLDSLETKRKQAVAEFEQKQVADAKQAIEKLLESPTADRAWRAEMRRRIGDINAFGEPNDPWLAEVNPRIATVYVNRAGEMRAAQRLAEGANLLAEAERLAPEAPGLAAEREALTAATAAFEKEQEEQARLARIDGLKQTFESQAKAGEVAGAAKTLEALRVDTAQAPDPFVTDEAPKLLAGAYYKLATVQAQEKKDFAAALKFAKACAELQPQRQECKLAVRDYTVDGNRQDLEKILARGDFDVADVLGKIAEVQVLDPGVFSEAEGAWSQAIATRLGALREAAGSDANDAIKQAKDVFAGNQMIAAIEEVPLAGAKSKYAAEIKKVLDAALLTKAKDLLVKASAEEGSHADIVQLKGAYNARIKQVKEIVEAFDPKLRDGTRAVSVWERDRSEANKDSANKILVAARGELDGALALWSDSAALRQRKSRIEQELAKLSGVEAPLPPPPPPTSPCTVKLAGHGKRKAGTCFYFVADRQPGPFMVVVPAGEGFTKPFAIGKFEITVADFNRYCRLSRKCDGLGSQDGALPATGVSLAQAQEYLAWLSERTGQTFRLPTIEEWTYAATAAGDQPKKDYNCRVEQGGQMLKGQGTMGVNTGKANGWGLYNYVGNAQEWVSSGAGVVARGGAFEDAFSKCDIALEKPHDGAADKATGFRIMLELGS